MQYALNRLKKIAALVDTGSVVTLIHSPESASVVEGCPIELGQNVLWMYARTPHNAPRCEWRRCGMDSAVLWERDVQDIECRFSRD